MSKTPKLTPEQRAEASILYERLAGDDAVLEQFIYSAVYIRAELECELAAERDRADKARREGWEAGMREAAYLIDKGKCVTDAAYEAQRSAILSAIEAKK